MDPPRKDFSNIFTPPPSWRGGGRVDAMIERQINWWAHLQLYRSDSDTLIRARCNAKPEHVDQIS